MIVLIDMGQRARIYREGDSIRFQPANETMAPMSTAATLETMVIGLSLGFIDAFKRDLTSEALLLKINYFPIKINQIELAKKRTTRAVDTFWCV